LEVCGSATPLNKRGSRFSGLRRIDCEGSGAVHVRYADEQSVDCVVGYVTSLPQTWEYLVRDRTCTQLLDQPRRPI
jgi:hypothetical protein